MSVELSLFDLAAVSFETRYAGAFLLWDRAGAVWSTVAKKYPQLTIDSATPQETKVNISEKAVGVVAADKTVITVVRPKSDLQELRDIAGVLFPAIFSQLEISTLARIGMLLQFVKSFQTREEASNFVSSQVPFPQPKGKHLNVSGRVLDPEMNFRYEDEALGFRYRLWANEVTMNINLPTEFRDVAPQTTKRSFAHFDIDYYAHGATARGCPGLC